MPIVVREDIDHLNAVLSITIEKSDYEQQFNESLKELQKRNIKGFRKGKIPRNILLKYYGKSVLYKAVSDLLQKEIENYLQVEKPRMFGQLLPSEEQENYSFKELKDFVFKFDMGLIPDFDLQGFSKEDEVERYEIIISNEKAKEYLDNLAKRMGTTVEVEEDIEENDILTIKAIELEEGTPKPEGIVAEFQLLVSNLVDESLKNELLSKKLQDSFRFNPFTLEEEKLENHRAFVKKHILQIGAEDEREIGEEFEGTIIKISRYQAAELNQAFFDQMFGKDNVKSEEEALELIKANLQQGFSSDAEVMLLKEIHQNLMEKNKFEVPIKFMKRLLKANNQKNEQKDEDLAFDMRWAILKDFLVNHFGLKAPTQEDIKQYTKTFLLSNYGVTNPDEVKKYLENKTFRDHAADRIMEVRILTTIKNQITVKKKPITVEDFQALQASQSSKPKQLEEKQIEEQVIEQEKEAENREDLTQIEKLEPAVEVQEVQDDLNQIEKLEPTAEVQETQEEQLTTDT